MSWLHCFWGIGAMTGPIIMSLFMEGENTWRRGYLTVAIIQIVLVIILFLTLPLWKKAEKPVVRKSENSIANADDTETTYNVNSNSANADSVVIEQETDHKNRKNSNPYKIKGVKLVLLTFLLYCGIESTLGLWGSSFLVNVKGINVSVAAKWIGMFYGGITLGRFFSGFLTLKLSNKMLIRIGQIILLIGAVLLILPLHDYLTLLGFILAGLGCAPIYPCMLHETPVRFGKENSQNLMGIQMAVAYTGATFLPPVFGYVASSTTMIIFPFVILGYVVIMLLGSEKNNLFFGKDLMK
jgi:fucose permease